MKQIQDFGISYTETNLSQIPVEPFATYSNLLFFLIVLYWWRQNKYLHISQLRSYLKFSLPILFAYVWGTDITSVDSLYGETPKKRSLLGKIGYNQALNL